MMVIGNVPYGDLRVGDRVVSCTGKNGYIGALVESDPWGNSFADWDGGILFLWYTRDGNSFSYSGWRDSQVVYLGSELFP